MAGVCVTRDGANVCELTPRQSWSSSGERFSDERGQLVPLHEECIVALGRVDLAIAGIDAGRGGGLDEKVDLAWPVEDVVLDPDAGQARPAVGKPSERRVEPAAVAADVVTIHRA